MKNLQVTDEESVYFGGIGYGSRQDVKDLSNLNIAMPGTQRERFR